MINDASLRFGPRTVRICLMLAELEDLDLATDLRLSLAWRDHRNRDNEAWDRALFEIGECDLEEAWIEIFNHIQRMGEQDLITEEIRNAAYDAVTAQLVRHKLSRLDFESLYRPWAMAVDNARDERPR